MRRPLPTIVLAAILLAAIVLAAAAPQRATAQDAEPKFDALVRSFQTEPLNLGLLIQVVGDVQQERTAGGVSGFTIAAAWLRMQGKLDGGFGYLFQANMAGVPSIVDAAVNYRMGAAATLQAGRFNVPFSRDLMVYLGSIDFVNRSRVVAALAPNRDVGVQLSGRPGGGSLEYMVGAFNGNRGGGGGNDNDALLYTGRLAFRPVLATAAAPTDGLEIAVNMARSEDSAAPIGGGFLAAFAGTRTLLGADMRLTRGRWLAAAELISAEFEFAGGGVGRPEGWQATGGYMVTPNSQALLRWDVLRSDGLRADIEQLIAGYNLWPTKATKLQVNYIVPTDGGGFQHHQVLVNMQLGF